jgi:hypothetical protein
MDQGMITVIITIITTLGGAKAWEFYQKKLEINRLSEKEDRTEQNLFRDDLRERVAVLENKLEESRNDKEKLLASFTELKTLIAEFKTRVEFLEKSIDDKDQVIEDLRFKNKILKEQLDEKEK